MEIKYLDIQSIKARGSNEENCGVETECLLLVKLEQLWRASCVRFDSKFGNYAVSAQSLSLSPLTKQQSSNTPSPGPAQVSELHTSRAAGSLLRSLHHVLSSIWAPRCRIRREYGVIHFVRSKTIFMEIFFNCLEWNIFQSKWEQLNIKFSS